jgi:methyl-accepting chemotaxis protein
VNECSQAFDQIVKDIDVINSITQEVVSASLEQSEGIEEVTKAMHQINQVTEHSSSMAQQSSNIAGKLKIESDKVYSTADNLSWLIDGKFR